MELKDVICEEVECVIDYLDFRKYELTAANFPIFGERCRSCNEVKCLGTLIL